MPAEAIATRGTLQERRGQLFATYVERMFARRCGDKCYSDLRTRHWLGWLARALTRQDQTIFYLERLQPEWLPTSDLRRWYTVIDRLGSGLLVGLVVGLVFGLAGGLVGALFGGPHEPSGHWWPGRAVMRSEPPSVWWTPER